MLRYIFSTAKDLTENEVEQIITTLETTNMKGSEFVTTLADKWRQEGMEKGREEGKAEGMRLGLVKSITRICMKKFGELPKEMRDELNQLDVRYFPFGLPMVNDKRDNDWQFFYFLFIQSWKKGFHIV